MEEHIFFRRFMIVIGIMLGILLVFIIVFAVFLEYADPNSYLPPERISYEVGKNEFNRETILSQISNGETDVFFETDLPAGEMIPEGYVDTNLFSDEELYEIVKYYLRTNWNEDPDDWRLYYIAYRIHDCENGLNGPMEVGFRFQKMVTINGEKYRDDRNIGLDSWRNIIVWNDKVEDRDYFSSEIKWNKINVNAFEAYQIAEENGGYEIHSEAGTECEYVYLTLSDNRFWNISYSGDSSIHLLEVKVNSKTGKVKY